MEKILAMVSMTNIEAKAYSIARFTRMLYDGEYPVTADAMRNLATAAGKLGAMADALAREIDPDEEN